MTQSQWQAVMGSNPSTIKGNDRPVETVSKNDAHDFLARLNAQNDGYKYRLPTEAEWEYAARAGTTGAQRASLDEIAWYGANSDDETHPVGKKKPNAWGLYDMLGNVREWVEDVFAQGLLLNSPLADPVGPPAGARAARAVTRRYEVVAVVETIRRTEGRPGSTTSHYMRGGGWDNTANFLRVSARYHYYGPTLRVSDIGFRAVHSDLSDLMEVCEDEKTCRCWLSRSVYWRLRFRHPLITRFKPSMTSPKPLTLVGKLTKVLTDNPHGWIYLRRQERAGEGRELGLGNTRAQCPSAKRL